MNPEADNPTEPENAHPELQGVELLGELHDGVNHVLKACVACVALCALLTALSVAANRRATQ